MSDISYEKLRRRVSEELSPRAKELSKTVEEVDRYFRYLGLGMAVWHPEKIHETNLGGLDAETYIGYSRIEGKWGLILRTIERDHESRAFVSQRVYTIESCGNVEIQANALRKIPELMSLLEKAVDQQIKTAARSTGEFESLRNADREF